MVKIVDAGNVVINNQKGLSSNVKQHRFHWQDDGGDDCLPSLTPLIFLTLLIFITYICTWESVLFQPHSNIAFNEYISWLLLSRYYYQGSKQLWQLFPVISACHWYSHIFRFFFLLLLYSSFYSDCNANILANNMQNSWQTLNIHGKFKDKLKTIVSRMNLEVKWCRLYPCKKTKSLSLLLLLVHDLAFVRENPRSSSNPRHF